MTMLRDRRWKFVHFEDLPPLLFDLEADPQELDDLGRDPGHAAVREQMLVRLFEWLRARRRFPTIEPAAIEAWNRREREAGRRRRGRWRTWRSRRTRRRRSCRHRLAG
jgi:hypothetical protein